MSISQNLILSTIIFVIIFFFNYHLCSVNTTMVDEQKELQDQEIIVNEVDGLPSLLDDKNDLYKAVTSEQSSLDDLNDEDLPTSLIVTNVDPAIFKDDDLKVVSYCLNNYNVFFFDSIITIILQKEMEMLFSRFGEIISVQYFRSFKRLRVNYGTSVSAANARIQMHQIRFYDTIINCYFAQVNYIYNYVLNEIF